MEGSIFERMGGTYRQEGDYFLPNLTVPESVPIGIWGQRRRQYLREHREEPQREENSRWGWCVYVPASFLT